MATLRFSLFSPQGDFLAARTERRGLENGLAAVTLAMVWATWPQLVDCARADVSPRTQASVDGMEQVLLFDERGETRGIVEVEFVEHCALCAVVAELREEVAPDDDDEGPEIDDRWAHYG